jgi:hypothetical protein
MPAGRTRVLRIASLVCFSLATFLVHGGKEAIAQTRVELQSERGVTQPIQFTPVQGAPASIVLLPGGNGLQDNFLSRVQGQFVAQGLNVALLGVPSDHATGVGQPFRASRQQALDIATVIVFLRDKSPAPVWLVATSASTVSAANSAIRLGGSQLAGIVLTEGVWATGLKQIDLAQIAVATFIVQNRNDGCDQSPYAGAEAAMTVLGRAPIKQLLVVESSSSKQGADPCGPNSPHGYYGIEDKVVTAIISWIKDHSNIKMPTQP